MPLDRETIAQLRHLLRPISNRTLNIAARATVHLANDAKNLQLLQIGVTKDEPVDDAQHFQPYGFSSVPLEGAEAVVIFPNGDREHPLVVAVTDRRYRPTGGEPGQVTIYHYSGSRIDMKADGTVVINGAATGPTGEGVVVGTGIDPFTGQTYNALQSASSQVFAKK